MPYCPSVLVLSSGPTQCYIRIVRKCTMYTPLCRCQQLIFASQPMIALQHLHLFLFQPGPTFLAMSNLDGNTFLCLSMSMSYFCLNVSALLWGLSPLVDFWFRAHALTHKPAKNQAPPCQTGTNRPQLRIAHISNWRPVQASQEC